MEHLFCIFFHPIDPILLISIFHFNIVLIIIKKILKNFFLKKKKKKRYDLISQKNDYPRLLY